MCKRCSSHVDLRDYQIANAVSKNFKTKGRFVIEEGGFLFNTESIGGEVILKGRLLGKLTAERSLEIHNSAEIKGTFKAAKLIIPAGNRFRWPDTLPLVSAEISGELVANLQARETVVLRSTARLFGNIEAGGLVVEEGAVLVGTMKIGPAVQALALPNPPAAISSSRKPKPLGDKGS
jgi:cytoskeletal protein CcmA (bactofilin family)